MNKPLLIIDNLSLKGTIDHFEEKYAVIEIEDGQKISWPVNKLDSNFKEGSSVRLVLTNDKISQEQKEKIAKELINQILKSD